MWSRAGVEGGDVIVPTTGGGVQRELAQERSVPAFVIFSDATLRELARIRPTTESQMRRIRGVGERKLANLGPRFLGEVASYTREHPPTGAGVLDASRPRR